MMVGLSELNSNKYKTILRYKTRISEYAKTIPTSNILPESLSLNNKTTDKFGDIRVKTLKRPYRREFTPTEVGEIIALYNSGENTIKLAKQFNCSKSTINKLLRQNGVLVTKKKARIKIDVDKAISMYTEMSTLEEIGEYFDVSTHTVREILLENGVKMRTRWDYT